MSAEPMSAPPPSHLRIAGKVRGPLSLVQLHQLVEGGAITPATEAAASAAGPWSRLETWPAYPELFPARPVLHFKAAQFEAVNSNATPPVDHRDLIAWANQPPSAGVLSSASLSPPKPEPSNEVLEIVREVARVDAQFAKPMEFPKRRLINRRFLHYLILAALGNGAMVVFILYYDALTDPFSQIITLGWTGLFNAGLAIIMLGVIPRY